MTRQRTSTQIASRPKCIVIAGDLGREMTDERRKRSFEFFRGSLAGVEVVTYDELFAKVETLVRLFERTGPQPPIRPYGFP